jgi:carbamoylphosphate synthase large subunit
MAGLVLVTGVGGPAGRSAAQFLKGTGIAVAATDMREVDAFVDQFHLVPAANDPGFVAALLRIVELSGATLLIPTVSEELTVVARCKDRFLELGCQVVVAPSEATDIANDKWRTMQVLAKQRIAVPKTICDGPRFHEEVPELGFPLIAKPRVSRGGRGVAIHRSPPDLAVERRKGIIYQQFLDGPEFDVNLYIDRIGQVRACVTLLKTKLRDGEVGNASAVERTNNASVAELATKACLSIGLTGPADVDIRMDSSGHPMLLEINARLGANVLSAPEVLESLLEEWEVM